MDSSGGLIPLIVGVIIYFIPSFAAIGKERAAAIFALNLLLGWTVIGWVVALVWAIAEKKAEPKKSDAPLAQAVPDAKVEKSPVTLLLEVMNRRKEHQIKFHGGELGKPATDCDECLKLEAVFYAVAKAENALPSDPETSHVEGHKI